MCALRLTGVETAASIPWQGLLMGAGGMDGGWVRGLWGSGWLPDMTSDCLAEQQSHATCREEKKSLCQPMIMT